VPAELHGNYEDGELVLKKVLELALKYGAVVIGTIDEEGTARTAEQRLRSRTAPITGARAPASPYEIFFDLGLPISALKKTEPMPVPQLQSFTGCAKNCPVVIILGFLIFPLVLNPAARLVLIRCFYTWQQEAGMDRRLSALSKISPD